MPKPTYYEMLRDPRWQRKRLEVMQRADFACEECGDKETTLNVHHQYYRKGAAPWEYPDDCFKCLCEPCHESRHDAVGKAKELLARLDSSSVLQVLGYIKARIMLDAAASAPKDIPPRFFIESDSHEEPCGIADAYCIIGYLPHVWDAILEARDEDGTVDHFSITEAKKSIQSESGRG